MRKKLLYIGILVANALLFAACGDHEQISSYEEIKEADLVLSPDLPAEEIIAKVNKLFK